MLRIFVDLIPSAGSVGCVILDVRDNPGGSLHSLRDILELFFNKTRKPSYTGPLVIVTNERSASAAEFLAGVLQDFQRALIVGTQTYGKGTIQLLKTLSSGSLFWKRNIANVKITHSYSILPSGKSLQYSGIMPDVILPFPDDSSLVPEKSQLYSLPPPSYVSLPQNVKDTVQLLKKSGDYSLINQETISEIRKKHLERFYHNDIDIEKEILLIAHDLANLLVK